MSCAWAITTYMPVVLSFGVMLHTSVNQSKLLPIVVKFKNFPFFLKPTNCFPYWAVKFGTSLLGNIQVLNDSKPIQLFIHPSIHVFGIYWISTTQKVLLVFQLSCLTLMRYYLIPTVCHGHFILREGGKWQSRVSIDI